MSVPGGALPALRAALATELTAIEAYRAVAARAAVAGPAMPGFVAAAAAEHASHARAFRAALSRLGGTPPGRPAAGTAGRLLSAVARARSPADWLPALRGREDLATETYALAAADAATPSLRGLFASVAAVEARHASVLLIAGALLAGRRTDLVETSARLLDLLSADDVRSGLPHTFVPAPPGSGP